MNTMHLPFEEMTKEEIEEKAAEYIADTPDNRAKILPGAKVDDPSVKLNWVPKPIEADGTHGALTRTDHMKYLSEELERCITEIRDKLYELIALGRADEIHGQLTRLMALVEVVKSSETGPDPNEEESTMHPVAMGTSSGMLQQIGQQLPVAVVTQGGARLECAKIKRVHLKPGDNNEHYKVWADVDTESDPHAPETVLMFTSGNAQDANGYVHRFGERMRWEYCNNGTEFINPKYIAAYAHMPIPAFIEPHPRFQGRYEAPISEAMREANPSITVEGTLSGEPSNPDLSEDEQ